MRKKKRKSKRLKQLPDGTPLTGIYKNHGWQVSLRRGGVLHNGGHYMDVMDAVRARDALALLHPVPHNPRNRKKTV